MNHRLPAIFLSIAVALSSTLLPNETALAGNKSQAESADLVEQYRETAARIITEATGSHRAFERVAYLSDYFPHRLSGSAMLEQAIEWTVSELEADDIPVVWKQEVIVPHWVRGNEFAAVAKPYHMDLPMLGLGGSVGTGGDTLTAKTVVVSSFDELEKRSSEIPGNIVVFNQPFEDYGQAVQYRVFGADRASAHGAVGVLLRAVSPNSMGHPHTGSTRYSDDVPEIPVASISAEAAGLLHRFDQRNDPATVSLYMEAKTMDEPALSHNIIAEIPGSEYPEEIVVIGGHIDSWDIGQGAMDDAGGVVVTWEALRLIHELNLQPKRTIRLVLWTNEENGVMGGRAYRDMVIENGEFEHHQIAFEVDFGVFKPLGFGFQGPEEALEMLRPVGALMAPLREMHLREGAYGTVDVGPLHREGMPIMGLDVETEKYFWYHHSAKDTVDKLDPDEVAECVAAVAVMAFILADMPERLPW
ncbi:M20/M25/M40 family metallo-hydrolase [Balneolales bacterium ANBcel1]|nr:M20/M25/M40 family metallo-hydrolase [Balneolales bacterium ANBcel1]